jgi:adenylosuccinate synthase
MINGFTSINITKLDVLTGLDTLKIGVAYTIDGKALQPGQMPGSIYQLSKVRIEYESMPGWKEDISGARSLAELPEAAQKYLARVSELLQLPISYIGVGPGRNDMIKVY